MLPPRFLALSIYLCRYVLCCHSGVSKADNADIPLVGTCIKAYQNIYVPRSSIDRNRAAKESKSGETLATDGVKMKGVSQMIAER